MKRILSLVITLALAITLLAACAPTDNTKITIGVMSGPTGMGMAKLMNDNAEDSEKYGFELYSDPTVGISDIASGKLNMLCLPTNSAANLAIKQSDYISVIAINCLGSLYLLTDGNTTISSVADLAGKTIYTSVATSTTKPIIDFILKENGVEANIVIEKDHDTLVAKIKDGSAPIAILPEPKVTTALIGNTEYSVDLNLSTEWAKVSETPLTMGCIVVRNDFLTEHKAAVNNFLKDYKASIEYIGNKDNQESAADMIFNAGVLPNKNIASKSLENLYGSIVYMDGKDMKAALVDFYTAIGMTDLPSDDFYYAK